MATEPDETIPYEQAREELVEVVRKLEAGGTTLEESLALWERGEQLATHLPGVARRCPRPARRGSRGATARSRHAAAGHDPSLGSSGAAVTAPPRPAARGRRSGPDAW